MSNTFFDRFNLREENVILISGDRFKQMLLQQLGRETVKAGFQSLIFSLDKMTYPVEGKVLVSDDLKLLPRLIENEIPQEIYIANKVQDDLLHPFTYKEIMTFARKSAGQSKVFISLGFPDHSNTFPLTFVKKSTIICSINLNLLKDSFPDITRLKEQKKKSLSDQVVDKVFTMIKRYCPYIPETEKLNQRILYIGQVKSIYDENVILPIARSLKSLLSSRVFIGDINTYRIKEV